MTPLQPAYWRMFLKDRIFLTLSLLFLLSLIIMVVFRHPSLEANQIPFELGLFFMVINVFFAFLSVRREPLLAYMFLTTAILMSGTLAFYFNYLVSNQV